MSEQVAPPPAPDQQPQQPGVQAPPPAEPGVKESGGKKKAFGIIGAIVAFLVIAALKFGVGTAIGNFFNSDETADAKVGDCISKLPEITSAEGQEVDGAKLVECTSTEAAFTVVGRVNDQTEAQGRSGEACEQYFKEEDDGYTLYSPTSDDKGYLLCLTKKA